ncbi:retrotransposon gag domain, retroviral aspartyl protease, partial [Tanacetum coccineum]
VGEDLIDLVYRILNLDYVVFCEDRTIAARLESMETLKEDVAALKSHVETLGKSYNDNHGERDPRGWILKAEKYFRYYQIPDAEKVGVASMHLKGNALDLFSWLSADQTITLWEELVLAFQIFFGPTEFQNPDEYLCSIKQTGSVQEYRQEFARRSARVSNWLENCLLGVFQNGLKEELKTDVCIQKPRTVYNAASLALEYELKVGVSKSNNGVAWSPSPKPLTADTNKRECFRCGEKYGPGHRCKTGTFKWLEASEEQETPINPTVNANKEESGDQEDFAEISLHAIFGKANVTTMKLRGTIGTTEVLILMDGGSTHNFISDSLDVSVQLPDLNIVQDFYPFVIGGGGADLVLGVHVEQEKISVIQSWPVSTFVKEVRGFLGLTGYYRRFVRNYGMITCSLTSLTKKDGFVWSTEALTAFHKLKQALMSTPVLRIPDFSKDFTVECDASSEGVGAILSQEDHPVAYFCKGFSPNNRFKSAYDRELLALVLAVQKWSHYLLGRHFLIRTNHYTLKFLLEQRITTTKQQRLLLKLMLYDFSVTYRAGKKNKGVDALSCRPHSGDLFTLSVPYCFEVVDIKAG